jgi:Protein of unknown function (DUF1573).
MKKLVFALTVLMLTGGVAIAQKSKKKSVEKQPIAPATGNIVTPAPANQSSPAATPAATPAANQNPDAFMKFVSEEHNFGNIPEGPAVSYDFEFKNIGKEPIVLSGVQASCGCTTPTWTKDPVLPGKSGKITATYNTQGRPGPFTKTITVNSNVGSKVIKITGTVEKAPDSSVPSDKGTIMKH